METRLVRASRLLIVAAACWLAALAPAQTKRALSHKDYDAWRSISGQALSRDGKWLAYAYMPQEGDGEVVVRELASGKEQRHAVGSPPPPPVVNPAEVTPEAEPPRRTIRLQFSSDGKYLVANTFPAKAEIDKAKQEKKKAEEMPKPGMLIVDLATGQASRVAGVKAMQVPERGGAWVAYHKEAKAGERPAAEAKPTAGDLEVDEDQRGQGRPGAAAAGGAGPRREYGTELVLRNLASGAERSFESAGDFSFARDGKDLLYTVSSRKEEENGLFKVTPGDAGAPVALLAGKGRYSRLSWDREQTQLGFLSDKDDAAAKQPKVKVYLWDRKGTQASEAVAAGMEGFRPGHVVSDRAPLSFSRDGKRLFVGAAPPPKAEPEPAAVAAAAAEDKVVADLWHWKDDFVQPMQRVRAAQERNRSFRGVYHIAEKKYVQLADAELQTVNPSNDGLLGLGVDDRPYRRMVDYDGNFADVYLVDTRTGARRRVAQRMRAGFGPGGGGGGMSWSPDGKHALYYFDKHWHVLDTGSGNTRNLTAGISAAFYNEEHDTPDPANSLGSGGWTRDGKSVLLYDRHDVWQVPVDGGAARNLTEGAGRKAKIQFRVVRFDVGEEDGDDEPGIDTTKPLYLNAVSLETRESGFYQDSFTGNAEPRRLLFGPKAYRFAARARQADVLLLTASRFDEFPDLHVTDSSFRRLQKVSDGDAQRKQFLWGSSELVRFKNADGVALQAALFKPENFDPKKKYPLMVYIYERLSQNVHNFVEPRPGTSINVSYYVSNGYLVLMPDIAYTIGYPGQSALKCVLPAIQEVVDQGYVNENAIAIQGHSWGGYQIAYMVTQTKRFRAAEAGAPVGNMTSAYSGIRWGSGLPRQFQYEKTQSRIGETLFESPLKFFENSPVFHVRRVSTPLLILHDDQDDAVPWYQGIELFLALRRNNKEAYLFNYNGEFHGLRRRHNQKDFTVRMQQFFDHHLKGAPAPEWMQEGIPFLEREEEKEKFKQASDR